MNRKQTPQTEIISPNIKSLIQSLRKSQLVGVSLEPMYYSLTLEFTHGTEGYNTLIRFFNVLHFIFSKSPEDKDEDIFFIPELDLVPIQDSGKEIFSSLNYPFTKGNDEPVYYPSESLYPFKTIGAACIEVVCGSYQVFQEVK